MTKVISIMVKICIDCGAPLIYTFAFRGKEYWCPSCGYTSGIFGAGVDVPVTEELKEKLRMSKKKSKVFLHAHGILKGGACATDYKGKQTEIKDLPLEYMDQLRKDLEGWEYEMQIRMAPGARDVKAGAGDHNTKGTKGQAPCISCPVRARGIRHRQVYGSINEIGSKRRNGEGQQTEEA